MSNTIIFAVGTFVFIAVATGTFIWGYLQFDALRVIDDLETSRADSARLDSAPAIEGPERAE